MPRNPGNQPAPATQITVHLAERAPTPLELRLFVQLVSQIMKTYATQSQQEKPNHEPAHS
jgi:hypothetical protein